MNIEKLENLKKIKPPTNCPSCSSGLIWKGQLLYCVNHSCLAQGNKKVEHFAKTLKIKGLGPKTIEQLELTDAREIFFLSKEEIQLKLGSEKLAEKLVEEIEKSKSASLQQVLPAFSIPLMGRSASEKLCSKVSDISEISAEICKEAGLGPKVIDNLIGWLNDTSLEDWPFSFKSDKKPVKQNKGIVCITGKLSSFKSKAEAEKVLTDLGYTVKSSITKDVNILINESGIDSAKVKKARSNNIKIIEDINILIGE